MARLTDRRFHSAKLILDRHNKRLLETRFLDAGGFERELRELWGMGYQELKWVMIDLCKKPEYTLLAARYMESGSPGVVCEFQPTLASLYGVDYYHAADREQRQKEFWDRGFDQFQDAMADILPMPK